MAEELPVGSEMDALPEGVEPVFEHLHHASSLQLSKLTNEFALTFSTAQMGTFVHNGERHSVAMNVPVASLVLSPQVLKDLSLLTAKAVSDFEGEWGTIETVYTRRMSAEPTE